MKSKGGIIAGITGLVLLLTLLFAWLMNDDKSEFNWTERYEITQKQPFDLSVTYDLLKNRCKESEFSVISRPMGEELPKLSWKDTANYVLIGGSLYLDSLALENLLSFVDQGNNAFLISRYFPENLMYRIYDYSCNPVWEPYSAVLDSVMEFNFYHPDIFNAKGNYRVKFHSWKKTSVYEWNIIDYSYFCGEQDSASQFISLGYLTRNDSNYVNYFKVPYGKGAFYFHSNPILFTNYFMVKQDGFDYAGRVFSHMSRGNTYWDERSKEYYFPKNAGFNQYGQHDIMASPLRYLLSQTALRWALYTALALVILYIFLRARRRQRPIPLMEPNTNSSLEFVTSIGRLYYLQRNHRSLCLLKERQFLAFLRNRYGLHADMSTEQDRRKVSEKSGVSISQLSELHKQFQMFNATSTDPDDAELIRFHQLLDEFYKTCK
ncbi:MAG: hypothetical protein IT233_06600 [Bacteroidia bacterium]|nr:hypothetical protein [Bacteroidia bacterium]